MSCALIWLEAPLQSWGHDSKFGRRATLPFPTRSGVMGLLCCAMGKGGEQRAWLAAMRRQELTVAAYAGTGAKNAPMLMDFHMVGSGYDQHDSWQDLMIPKKSDGSRPSNTTGARLTYRYYLQDMAFACVLELPANEAANIEKGLSAPVWPICLGRKCCVPVDIVWRGHFVTQSEAFSRAVEIATSKNRKEIFRVEEGVKDAGETRVLADVPVCFGPYKEYAEREVTIIVSNE